MTAAGALIAAAGALGVELRLHGGRLQVLDEDHHLTPELRAALREHAAAIVEHLADDEDEHVNRRDTSPRAASFRSRESNGWRFWDGTYPTGWTCGNHGVEACVTCSHGTAARDPDGIARHPFRCA